MRAREVISKQGYSVINYMPVNIKIRVIDTRLQWT